MSTLKFLALATASILFAALWGWWAVLAIRLLWDDEDDTPAKTGG